MKLHTDYSGNITINSFLRPQMIFQDATGSLNPRMKVGSSIREVLRIYGSKNIEKDLQSLLKKVGLSEIVSEQYPREISGGQSQRVSIARALAANTDLLIADEPVSALDVSVQARILNLLRELNKQTGLSVVLIAHDLAVVKNICDDIVVMHNGLVEESGRCEDVFNNPKSEYTKTLLNAVPGQNLFL
jgi:ABC-type dipeptide/oligopeptide/nickel transport system ATPase subunit